MGLANIARTVEQVTNRRGIVSKRQRGWLPRILPYRGYGSTSAIRILARAVMEPPSLSSRANQNALSSHAAQAAQAALQLPIAAQAERGWRQFFTTQVGYLPVTVTVGGRSFTTRTDESGYIDFLVEDHGLAPGHHTVSITPVRGEGARADVVVIDPQAGVGIISDIDDTIMVTALPRPMLAAWNSFVLHTNARKAVPGMSDFYANLRQAHPQAPIFYLSTGAWNTAPTLEAFIGANGLPSGPLLMTDWGPTPTGLFRSGQEHKKTQLRNLLIMFPNIRWILVGDDGQHDPLIYDELAREHPSRVEFIALRELDPVEQVLAHGLPMSPEGKHARLAARIVPTIRGKDGFDLLEKWRAITFGGRSYAE